MRSLRNFLLPLLLLTSCGGEATPEGGSSTTVEIPLGSGGENGGGAPPAAIPASSFQDGAATAATAAPAAAPAKPPKAAPASSPANTAAAAELDRWHRRTAASRAPAGTANAASAALAELQQALTGGAAAIQTRWATQPPKGLGAEATRLASAFGREGTAGLERALAATTGADPARLAFHEILVVRALELQETSRAGAALGRLLATATSAGYPRERILEWAPHAVAVADGIGKVLASTEYAVASGDSYWKICSALRKQGQPIQPGWVKLFNRKRGDGLTAGAKLRIPSVPLRVECWRQLRLTAVYAGEHVVRLYASSSGKPETPTPLGEFTLQICEKEPIYYPPGGVSVPYKNPENPLGERWLGFAEDRQYGLHGTNSESTIGSFETGGCVRMHNADVIELFDLVGPGAKVKIHP
jgi:lipoprotein-anchoring transpeptidase ErfK/SrfK